MHINSASYLPVNEELIPTGINNLEEFCIYLVEDSAIFRGYLISNSEIPTLKALKVNHLSLKTFLTMHYLTNFLETLQKEIYFRIYRFY